MFKFQYSVFSFICIKILNIIFIENELIQYSNHTIDKQRQSFTGCFHRDVRTESSHFTMLSLLCALVKMFIHIYVKNMVPWLCVYACVFLNKNYLKILIQELYKKMASNQHVFACKFSSENPEKIL